MKIAKILDAINHHKLLMLFATVFGVVIGNLPPMATAFVLWLTLVSATVLVPVMVVRSNEPNNK